MLGHHVFPQLTNADTGRRLRTLRIRPPHNERNLRPPLRCNWGNLQVSDVHPATVSDLFSGQPVVLHGRFRGNEPTTITVSGRSRGRRHSYTIPISAGDLNARHPELATIWAREHIAALEQEGRVGDPQRSKQIADTALEYGLMSAYTTFLVIDATADPAD